jgi:DNA-binding MarR family transcriptional regulator
MTKEELMNSIVDYQRQVDRARRQGEFDVWMSLDVTMPQLKSLFFIYNEGSTNLATLANALGVTSTNTTGIVDRLVKQGLVSRTDNPENRRMLLLKATKKGEQLIARLRERRKGYLLEVLGRLNTEELELLNRGFGFLARATESQEQVTRKENSQTK